MIRDWTHPDNRWILYGICAVQMLLIALPFFKDDMLPTIVVMVLFSVVALFGSVTTAVLYLCFSAAVVPSWFYEDYLVLPMDFQFYEGLLVVVGGLAGLTWLLDGRWNWHRHTRLDLPMLVFLGLIGLSVVIGQVYGQSTSEMLRSVRYPLYYALFFVVTWYFNPQRVSLFLYMVLVASGIVGIEYLIEFLAMVNLSVSGAFYRVARLEGIMLPIGILIAMAVLLYETKMHRRLIAWGMLVPIGLALMITVGRGMWISLSAGLGVLGILVLIDRQKARNQWRHLSIVAGVPLVFFGLLFGFQHQMQTGIGEVAVKRISSAVNYEQDPSIVGRLLSYQTALRVMLQRPIFGGGHGATVTFLVTDIVPPELVTIGAVDNVYLTIGMRMGLVGIISFLWLYGIGLWYAYHLFQQSQDPQTRLFCAAFIAVYVMMLIYGVADATLMVNRLIFIHAAFLGLLGRLDLETNVCTNSLHQPS